MRFQFGSVVVVDDDKIGVIVKSWADGSQEVYVREYNNIGSYQEKDIRHFIYSKSLTPSEYEMYE